MAEAPQRKLEYEHLFQGFRLASKNKGQSGALGEVPLVQAPVGHDQVGGRALWTPEPGVAPLQAIFWLRESSGTKDFWEFFENFLRYFNFHLFCAKIRHPGSSAENNVRLG